ncbi:unnamed protein product, partial [marine sediment metagenome]
MLTESISLSDTLTKTFSQFLVLTETIVLQHNQFTLQVQALITETGMSLSDSVTHIRGKSLMETISLVDTYLRRPGKMLTETISLIDTDTWVWEAFKELTETMSLTDTILKMFTLPALTETISLQDSITKRPGKMLTEILNHSLSLTKLSDREIDSVN